MAIRDKLKTTLAGLLVVAVGATGVGCVRNNQWHKNRATELPDNIRRVKTYITPTPDASTEIFFTYVSGRDIYLVEKEDPIYPKIEEYLKNK